MTPNSSSVPIASSGQQGHHRRQGSFPGLKRQVSLTRKPWLRRTARHTLGLVLLLITVFLWTASSFLASTIFADDTYSKPYFVTYVNSCFFTSLLLFDILKRKIPCRWSIPPLGRGARSKQYAPIEDVEEEDQVFFKPVNGHTLAATEKMDVPQTAKLGFTFGLLWFAANYFTAACLEYTTVASSTILTSTSSIWTLIFATFVGVERFTFKKLFGVLASFAGIILTSSVDISGSNDANRGTFPHKSSTQIAVGDVLALISAVIYGVYATTMKKKIGDESKVNMPLFFGFVGLFGMIVLLPGFPLLHYTGVEKFQLPPTRRVIVVILVNAVVSLVSDVAWAYSMLLISPLVVTVGLSLTIPLSLVGQMIINSQSSNATYWIGAAIVLVSFLFINYESTDDKSIDESVRDLDRPTLDDFQEPGAG